MVLRCLEARDRAEYVRVHEASARLYADWLPARGPEVTWSDWFDGELEKNELDTNLRLVGALPDGRFAGFFNLGEIVRGFFWSAYAGWRTNVEVAGQGYGYEGVKGMLDVAFSAQPGLHRVQANIVPTNAKSIRIAERAGFRREGLALKYLQIAGTWQDHVMFAKLAEEHVAGRGR